jgi:hypothetical protein
LRVIRTQLLRIERSTLQDLQRQAFVDNETVQTLASQIDARMVAVQSDRNTETDPHEKQPAHTPSPAPDILPPTSSEPSA